VNYRWDLRSSGMLRNVDWRLVTEVSVRPTSPISRRAEVQEKWVTNFESNIADARRFPLQPGGSL